MFARATHLKEAADARSDDEEHHTLFSTPETYQIGKSGQTHADVSELVSNEEIENENENEKLENATRDHRYCGLNTPVTPVHRDAQPIRR